MDSFRAMKWLCIGLVDPIAVLSLLAIPLHLTIAGSEILVGHYAKLAPERFRLSQARRATLVDGERCPVLAVEIKIKGSATRPDHSRR